MRSIFRIYWPSRIKTVTRRTLPKIFKTTEVTYVRIHPDKHFLGIYFDQQIRIFSFLFCFKSSLIIQFYHPKKKKKKDHAHQLPPLPKYFYSFNKTLDSPLSCLRYFLFLKILGSSKFIAGPGLLLACGCMHRYMLPSL